ncbi:hypothetical protein SLNWT_1300 [Streptomyces albus]|uniref:Uncharacterized protein n=1 Tax=Streptomyces albus (strain ATCC 21838 / DSM 41398 / FERM P-419 / JCM 4703 / NBRC 107858) TaxID=1081613 RepID=A0A0B5ESG5_STRA4|nr:hypothetical protein SLNWT_1300 [Streptomyces albus]AOU75992.1 hypothetical protein SLNHY_1301 [Streptomyces albus]AYN31793.1 hypothetical protein DUI70_1290 [Streptomyces albus]
MNVTDKPSSRDAALQEAFGAEAAGLYAQVAQGEANTALQRALELRSFLAVAEEQVARVRDRVHAATGPDGDMGDLSAEDLRWDADWLDAALAARDGYSAALDELLRAMPAPDQAGPARPGSSPKITTAAPPAPAAPRAGAVRTRRP